MEFDIECVSTSWDDYYEIIKINLLENGYILTLKEKE
jgi:hypothetical protein